MGISTFLVIFWLQLCLRQRRLLAASSISPNTVNENNPDEMSKPAGITSPVDQTNILRRSLRHRAGP